MPEPWGIPWNKREELSEKQVLFLDWLTGERPEGESQNGFAERIGVDPGTLSKWKKHPLFVREWEHRMRTGAAAPSILQDQLRVLNEKALAGDVKAIELYWRLVDRMAPQRFEIQDDRDASELSDAELAAQLQAAQAQLKAV